MEDPLALRLGSLTSCADRAEWSRRDVPEAEIHLLDTGHFALEEDLDRIVALMKGFFARRVRGGTVRGARTPVAV